MTESCVGTRTLFAQRQIGLFSLGLLGSPTLSTCTLMARIVAPDCSSLASSAAFSAAASSAALASDTSEFSAAFTDADASASCACAGAAAANTVHVVSDAHNTTRLRRV